MAKKYTHLAPYLNHAPSRWWKAAAFAGARGTMVIAIATALGSVLDSLPLPGCNSSLVVLHEGTIMRITLLFALAAVLVGCECCPPQNAMKPAAESKPALAPAAPKPAAVAAAVPVTPVTDAVTIGDDASEAAHGHKGQLDETGDWSDRTYRHSQGGWFSWDFKVIPGQPALLTCTYWGSDQRTFDILIDGKKLLTENINSDHPETFFDKSYTIPAAMTQGKQKLTVRFQAPDAEGYAGGVFGAKMTSPAPATRPSGQ